MRYNKFMNTHTHHLAIHPDASSPDERTAPMSTLTNDAPELLQYTWPNGHVTRYNNYNPTPSPRFVVMYKVRPSNGADGIWLECGKTDDPANWQAQYGDSDFYANMDLHFAPLVPREVAA